MSNALFPTFPGLAWPVKRKPQWRTTIQETTSGREVRTGFWSYPYYEYVVDIAFLRSKQSFTELQTLIGFFNARGGSFDDWLYDDPNDNVVVNQGFGVGTGSQASFQLVRTYGGYAEPVRATASATPTVRINSVGTTAYTLNQNTGLLTFSVSPANGAILDWSGNFYWRCRFEEDELSTSMFFNGHAEAKSLKFRTLK